MSQHTVAAVAHRQGAPFVVEQVSIDGPLSDEVLVRILGVGLCHTDLTAKNHLPLSFPIVLGHEGAGVVEQVGSAVEDIRPGDRVVLTYASCGHCSECRADRSSYCETFTALNLAGTRSDGSQPYRDAHGCFFGQSSFAGHALVRSRNLVPIPDDVPTELFGPLGCSMQTGAGTVLNVLKPAKGASIAIFGAGAVGLAAVMAAKVAGCGTIAAIDLSPSRLALAAELGATRTILGGEYDPVSLGEVDFSVECTGIPSVLSQAASCLRATGTCALVGLAAPGATAAIDVNHLLQGRSIRGVMEGDAIPRTFIPELIALWREGRFPFDRLITSYPLEEINRAVADVERGETVKAVLIP